MKKRSTLGVTLTGGLEEEVTPWAGAALLVELYRKAGIGADGRIVYAVKHLRG